MNIPQPGRMARAGTAALARAPEDARTDASGDAPGTLRRLARRHGTFGVLVLAGAAIRADALIGYLGVLRTPDSTRYLANALHLAPGTVRPSGYSVMLWLLEPLHSLTLVVGVQLVMGLLIGITGYALLVRRGLPGWGATIAMAPVLLSASAVQLEHFLLSDTLFDLLVMAAVALIGWWRQPPVWAHAVAGLLIAAATLTRSEGTPLLIAFVIYLIARFSGWRTLIGIALLGVSFAVPVAGYAAWYEQVHGRFELTSSTGAFLYGAAATFANCARIRPPATERSLCPTAPARDRKWSDYYVFGGPISVLPGGPFGQRSDTLGSDFALRAIRAQPADYLSAVAGSFWQNFQPPVTGHPNSAIQRNLLLHQNEYRFPTGPPPPARSGTARLYAAYNHDPAGPVLHVIQPYAGWLRAYQRYLIVPGPLLGVILVIGLAGLLAGWRQLGGDALLPWLVGMALLATPAMIVEAYPRYLVGDVPYLCVAAGLAVPRIARAIRQRLRPAGDGASLTGRLTGRAAG
ncbi:MAG: hypothetical protein ACYCO9_04305 [Streptosporangiaceae bacterium]